MSSLHTALIGDIDACFGDDTLEKISRLRQDTDSIGSRDILTEAGYSVEQIEIVFADSVSAEP